MHSKQNMSNTTQNPTAQCKNNQKKTTPHYFPLLLLPVHGVGKPEWAGEENGKMKEMGMTSVASSYFQEVPSFKSNLADCMDGREEQRRLLAYCSFQTVFLGLAFRLGLGTNGQEMYGISTSCQMICYAVRVYVTSSHRRFILLDQVAQDTGVDSDALFSV